MAPFVLLALVVAAANPDLPIGRNAPPVAAPAAAPASPSPIQVPAAPAATSPGSVADSAPGVSSAPSDDYGYVAFCYGAESAYLGLYDQVMPEVTRIERAFPGTTPIDQALAEYPQLRSESQANLTVYADALTLAERGSVQPLAQRGVQLIQQGRATWSGAAIATPAQTAQAWMGWSPPEDCVSRAKTLADSARLVAALVKPGTSPGSVDMDRAAHPALAAAPRPATPAIAAATPPAAVPPPPLVLRGEASAPVVSASAAPPAGGLAVSFGAAAPLPASSSANSASAPSATPPGLPPLVTAPPTPSGPDPLPWRGVL